MILLIILYFYQNHLYINNFDKNIKSLKLMILLIILYFYQNYLYINDLLFDAKHLNHII